MPASRAVFVIPQTLKQQTDARDLLIVALCCEDRNLSVREIAILAHCSVMTVHRVRKRVRSVLLIEIDKMKNPPKV